MMFIPTLLTPRILGLKNRWRTNYDLKSQLGRDVVLTIFSIAVVVGIYVTLTLSLERILAAHEVAYLHPSTILGLIFMFLFGLLLFSNGVAAIGLLLLGQDLDLILSAPVNRWRFFIGKLCEVIGSSTWMVLVFGLPAIVGFAQVYGAQSPAFYLQAAVILLPFFVIPSAISIIAVLLFTSLIPATRTRELLIVAGALGVVALYFLIKIVVPTDPAEMAGIYDILKVIRFFNIPASNWTPPYWAAVAIGDILEPTSRSVGPYLGALYAVAIALGAGAYLAVRLLHTRAFSMSRSHRQSLHINSRQRQKVVRLVLPWASPHFRALFSKEVSVFLRDLTQTIQLMLLLGLCAIYLYNLRVLRVVEELPIGIRHWWQGFLIIANMAMGAFVIAAVCTRFVFPSVSMEGQSYWIVRTAPISLQQILRTKFWIWLVPVTFIGTVLLVSGAFAIRADPQIVLASGLLGIIVCYGIVGLAVGLGAVYANFTWEHTSQLAASFGSLIFMISSSTLIGINMLPTTLIIMLRGIDESQHSLPESHWYATLASCIVLLAYINYVTTRWALKVGENSLRERELRG
jgi:ABC-2 type transport system permease protein